MGLNKHVAKHMSNDALYTLIKMQEREIKELKKLTAPAKAELPSVMEVFKEIGGSK